MKKRSRLSEAFSRRKALFTVGVIMVLIIAFFTIFGPMIWPADPIAVNYDEQCLPPSAEHWFGTDNNGRDVFIRVLNGAHISIGVALAVVLIGAVIGVTVGIVAGFAGGAVDSILMRIVEIMLSFPGTIFALAVLGTLGNGIWNQIVALSFVRWAHYARLVRVETLTVVNSEYLTASRAMGNSRWRIIWRYILPNIIGRVVVIATLSIGPVILAGASLSYLGLGAQIPSPEWGLMINGGKDYLRDAPWMTLAPGLAAVFSVFAFNLLGEGISDLIDPRLKEKAEVD